MTKMFAVDASGYLYSCYFAIRNMTNSKGESTNALYGFIRSLLKLMKDFEPQHLVAVFDGPRNGMKRKALYPEYKAHRAESPADLHYQIKWAEEFCHLMGIPVLNIAEVEADDTLGSISKWAESHQIDTYLCTSDKDMCQLVNDRIRLLNTRKDNLIIGSAEVEEIHGVPPAKMIDLLAMIGDASDNVPGLPGVGPKTAIALLKQFGSLDELLAHPEQIGSEKRRASIMENTKLVLLSRELVTIDQHVDIPIDLHYYQLKNPDLAKLQAFYSQMGFHSLLKELNGTAQSQSAAQSQVQSQPQVQQLELFDFENGIAKIGQKEKKYQLVDDEKSLEDFVEVLKQQKEMCFDVVGSDLRPMRAKLVGIGFCTVPGQAWYVPANGNLGLSKVLQTLKPIFEDAHISFYGHNIKYDCHVLANYGVQIASISFDTLVASYLLNSHNRQHSLDHLVLQYFGKVKAPLTELTGKGKNAVAIELVPLPNLCHYCCEEVDDTCRLKLEIEKELKRRHLDKLLFELELPLLKVLAKMERHGIYLDLACLKEQAIDLLKMLHVLEEEIYRQAGERFNINSPQQLSRILQDKLKIVLPKKTATGFSTNADILESLQEAYPICRTILEYRTLEKLRSTYVENLPSEVNPETHRIHCTFNQSVAATGRLSCQDPNLQNIPVRTEVGRHIRQAFCPQKPGWSYLAADYSQIELRLLAHLCEDPILVQAFSQNEDIHTSTAAAIFNALPAEVSKEQRYKAKAVNFGLIYGQQAFGLAKELRIDVKEAAAIIEMYFKRYSKVKEYLEFSKAETRRTGKAVTFTGRERLIPEINSSNGQLRQLAERLAVNTPIQGTQADLIKLAMLSIDKKLAETHLKGYMILQIHDELIFEIPDEEKEVFSALVRDVMQDIVKLKVPLVVDIAIGKNWKEC